MRMGMVHFSDARYPYHGWCVRLALYDESKYDMTPRLLLVFLSCVDKVRHLLVYLNFWIVGMCG
jgi:hypothetical protein